MKKIVIFGGSGFLGSYVADELSQRGFNVVIADLIESNHLKSNQKFIKVDIMNLDEIINITKTASIVYNFSAIAELEEAIKNPIKTFEVNVLGNLNILEACKQVGCIERFIYASSAYSLSAEGSFYGISKHSSEKLTEEYFKKYGLKYTVIRYGSLYGERASHNNYIYNLLMDAIQSGELTYKEGDDQDLREYIHAADAAKLSVDVIEDKQYENEHIILTGTERLKRIELLTMINEIMQNQLKIKEISGKNIGHYKITPYTYDSSVAKKLVANPFIDLGQGLLECIKQINKELNQSDS
ncbi:MAG: NAD(P)-dependent oxidoreductase [Euryarchaeota archaeon TMED85]|nr:MAG: NAD(P)-dependent oxidoreductase [Euryarchaeota archaeon TMED85]|tara:strand:+ start:13567 stop:14460 length:894 start_codon:yes stop_codon:yes gene_type:complete